MYETVKEVKGYKITRLIGSRGFYHVMVTENAGYTFHTIKAAVTFIEKNL